MASQIIFHVSVGEEMPDFALTFEVGTHVQIWGRIQSRDYVKKLSETQVEQRTAYEVSVSKIEA